MTTLIGAFDKSEYIKSKNFSSKDEMYREIKNSKL